jgi:transposase
LARKLLPQKAKKEVAMSKKKHNIKLTEEERTYLAERIASGEDTARSLRRAMILLKADQGEHGPAWSDEKISEAFVIGKSSVYQIRKQYHERGLKGTLSRKKPDRIYERCLDGAGEAHLIALACSKAPDGYDRWSLRMLKDEMIELAYVDRISHETIRSVLKKQTQALAE